jgi:hypothetical protein
VPRRDAIKRAQEGAASMVKVSTRAEELERVLGSTL